MFDYQQFREIVRGFDASSAVEVLFIAALIFAALRLMSGTRAMGQARAAIVFLLGAVLLGRAFDLRTVNFIVDRSLPALLVGAAVLFQPELRRGLERIGRAGFRGLLDEAEESRTITSVVQAATGLAAERHGGLIVFERGTRLQEIINTGIAVDARVSPELLAGIFYPNSPMHDMAVVVRDERVVAAGCVLPLASELPAGHRSLGTRHRAAIGVTEHTDAFSVVVSEETGEISVAYGGRLVVAPDERRLRAMMEALLDARVAARPARRSA